MAKTLTSLNDEKHELTRRALIKWSLAAGAALGVSAPKILEVIEKVGGKDLAFAAAARPNCRSVTVIGGNGGHAHNQLFWPQVAVADANSAQFAYHAPGTTVAVAGTDNPLRTGKDTPWATLAGQKQVTCFLAGTNQTHTQNPNGSTTLNNNGIVAVMSAIQASSPSVLPFIAIGQETGAFGTAAGAAIPTAVATGPGIASVFNSVASRAGGMLAQSTDAMLYKAQYEGYIQLNRAANRSTTHTSYTTATGAAGFLGQNLASQLTLTATDNANYGLDQNPSAAVAAVGQTLATAAKAFKLNLTNGIVMPFMLNDPHGMFDNKDYTTVMPQLCKAFNAFMADMQNTIDENTGTPLSDDLVINFHGDTTKNPLTPAGWPDGTPGNTNVIYVYSSGHLMSGWWGGIDTAGKVTGFDATGKAATYNGAQQATIANAAIAFATAKRDARAIQQFANGVNIEGIFGRVKVT